MSNRISSVVGRQVFVLFALLASLPAAKAGINDCPAILPADAAPLGELRLCRAAGASPVELTACRNYGAGNHVFKIEFQGGVVPVSVRRLPAASRPGEASSAAETVIDVGKRGCDLARPTGVPRTAVYRGTGVCREEHDRPLPCSVFEGASARQPVAMRYFAYYEPDGRGVRQIDALPAGPNDHALEAELAFQLGQALAATECCREEARGYVAHAAGLFPADSIYRSTLNALAAAPVASTVAEVSNCVTGSTPSLSASNNGP
jgi:hypothetical protein